MKDELYKMRNDEIKRLGYRLDKGLDINFTQLDGIRNMIFEYEKVRKQDEAEYIIYAYDLATNGQDWNGALTVPEALESANECLQEAEKELEEINSDLDTLKGEAHEIALLSCVSLENDINELEYFIEELEEWQRDNR
jgi:hypothetical protein